MRITGNATARRDYRFLWHSCFTFPSKSRKLWGEDGALRASPVQIPSEAGVFVGLRARAHHSHREHTLNVHFSCSMCPLPVDFDVNTK